MEDVYYIHVDSKNRDTNLYPYGNTYVVNIPHVIKSVVKVELMSAKVPNSMYNLTQGISVCSTHLTPTLSLSPGFYSSCTLSEEINLRFNTLSESIYYLQAEGKFIYLTNDPSGTITINSNELGKLLGMSKGPIHTVSLLDVPLSGFTYGFKSDRVVDFSLNEYVFLDIEEFRTPFFSESGVFAVIPMDVPSTQIKTFKENTDFIMSQTLTQQQTISRLTIHWYDKNLNHLNFQGFENNGFVLRVYTKRVVNKNSKEEEDKPDRKLVDAYIQQIKTRIAEEQLKETKKTKMKFGKWTICVALIGLLFFWYVTKKTM